MPKKNSKPPPQPMRLGNVNRMKLYATDESIIDELSALTGRLEQDITRLAVHAGLPIIAKQLNKEVEDAAVN